MHREHILSVAHDIATTVVAERSAWYDAQRMWPERPMRALQQCGLMGLVVPREHGGMGEGLEILVRVCEILGRFDPSVGICFGMHQVAAACLSARATPEQAREVLRPICEGRHITSLALSEAGTGSHSYFPDTRIEREGDHYVVTGTKAFVTNAGHADSYVVSGKSIVPGAPPGHFSLLVVPADTPGLEFGPPWSGWGLRANDSRKMDLKRVQAPAWAVLGGEGQQIWYVFHVVAPYFLSALTGTYLGAAGRALDETIAGMKTRRYEHTRQSLAEISVLQHKLGRMFARLERTRQLAYGAAARMDAGDPDALPAILAAKAEVAGMAVSVVNDALSMGGGRAYAGDTLLTRLLRDVRAADVMAPTTDILYTWTGRALLGLPLLGF